MFLLLYQEAAKSQGAPFLSTVDFIATKAENKLYVQVTESMLGEDTRRRELAPLQKIPDNYEKIILSLDRGLEESYEGIRVRSIIDLLLQE